MSKLDKLRKQLQEFSEHFSVEGFYETITDSDTTRKTKFRLVGEKCVIQVEYNFFKEPLPTEKDTYVVYWIIYRDEICPDGVMRFGEGKGSKHFDAKTLKKAFQSFASIEGYENIYIM